MGMPRCVNCWPLLLLYRRERSLATLLPAYIRNRKARPPNLKPVKKTEATIHNQYQVAQQQKNKDGCWPNVSAYVSYAAVFVCHLFTQRTSIAAKKCSRVS